MDILKQSIVTNVPMADLMQQSQVAETPEQQQEGLRNQPEGTIMTFPESTGNFNTVGMDYPIDIQKVSPQGDLVRSYENVPPGVESLPMGDDVGTVIETPANYQDGGFDAWKEALPSNLRNSDTTTYNLRGAYEAGLTPTIAPDGKYHLQSVNPKTLEFLKASDHKSTKEEIAWFKNQKNTKALMGTPHPSTHKIVKDPSGYFGERSLKYVKKQEGDFSAAVDNTRVAPTGIDFENTTQEMFNNMAFQEEYEKNKHNEMWLHEHGIPIPDADASHLTFEAMFPYSKTLKAAKWGVTPKTVAFTKEGVKKIPKSQVTRLNRVEDANITSKTFNKYEDGNWFLNQPNEFYVNLTKRNPNLKGSTKLAPDEAKRLITANVDKELAKQFNVASSTNRAKTLSGGAGNKYVDTEYILPPEIVKSMRSGSGPGYSTHIGDSKAVMEQMTQFYKQEGDFKEDNIVIQNAQKAAEEKRDFSRLSKTWFPGDVEPTSFAGKVIDMLPASVKVKAIKTQKFLQDATGIKIPGGVPICYGNTCVQSTSEILKESGKWEGKLEQDNDAFAKDYASHGYELVQEENALPGDIVQFYKGTYDNRDYSHMGIHGKDGQYFNDGYFDKPWHEKNEPTTAELMKNSKIPLNNKAIGKVYYRYKKE